MIICSNTALCIILAAYAMGLGSVRIQAIRSVDEFRRILNILGDKVPIAVITLGYPNEKPPSPPRRSIGEMTHINVYGTKLPKS